MIEFLEVQLEGELTMINIQGSVLACLAWQELRLLARQNDQDLLLVHLEQMRGKRLPPISTYREASAQQAQDPRLTCPHLPVLRLPRRNTILYRDSEKK